MAHVAEQVKVVTDPWSDLERPARCVIGSRQTLL